MMSRKSTKIRLQRRWRAEALFLMQRKERTKVMEQYIAEIVIAIISMVGTMSGAYFANRKSTALVAYRLEQLEKKQDIHNGVIDRVYKLEKGVALNKEDIKVANHRIEDLERKG